MTRVPVQVEQGFVDASERLPVLYKLVEEFKTLVGLLEDPEADEDEIDMELARSVSDIKAKAYGIAIVIQGMDNKVTALKNEEARLYTKRKAAENAAERLRAYTLHQMRELGEDRIDTGTFLLSIRPNPQSVVVLEEMMVPKEFKRTVVTTTVDKNAIKAHVKATGEIPPGVDIQRGERLSIS